MYMFNILEDKELNVNSVVKDYLATVLDGNEYSVTFYSLDMVLPIGIK